MEKEKQVNDTPVQRNPSKLLKFARYVSAFIIFSGAAFFAYAGYTLRDDIVITSQVSYVFAAVLTALLLFMLYPWERQSQTKPFLFKVFLAFLILSIISALQILALSVYYFVLL